MKTVALSMKSSMSLEVLSTGILPSVELSSFRFLEQSSFFNSLNIQSIVYATQNPYVRSKEQIEKEKLLDEIENYF